MLDPVNGCGFHNVGWWQRNAKPIWRFAASQLVAFIEHKWKRVPVTTAESGNGFGKIVRSFENCLRLDFFRHRFVELRQCLKRIARRATR